MKVKMTVDDTQLKIALKKINFGKQDLLDIEGAGAYVVVNGERMRVPVQTSATRNSIKPHIIEADDNHVVDEVGPETDYALYLEYGTGIYADGGKGRQTPWTYYSDKLGRFVTTNGMKAQPFIRPTAEEDKDKVQAAISAALGALLRERWPR
jgi:HK97 gp10 family phage protein